METTFRMCGYRRLTGGSHQKWVRPRRHDCKDTSLVRRLPVQFLNIEASNLEGISTRPRLSLLRRKPWSRMP